MTITPSSPLAKSLDESVKQQIKQSDINTNNRKLIEESGKIIVDEHVKISRELMKTQSHVADSTKDMAKSIRESFGETSREMTQTVTAAIKELASDLAETITATFKKQNEKAMELHVRNSWNHMRKIQRH